jgi:hypothetical protein
MKKIAVPNPEWEQTLVEIGNTMQRVIPRDARVLVVDKYDPTLLHLSQREGWHFPDRGLMPGGYPSDSDAAIHHLEELRQRGAEYIVFPSAAFWWLDYYEGFRQYLDARCKRISEDENCVIYNLSTSVARS